MSVAGLYAAMANRKFTGVARLCWLAFGDGDGYATTKSVARWIGANEDEAFDAITGLVAGGYVARLRGEFFVATDIVLQLNKAEARAEAMNDNA